jgi:hypothetical protein
MASTYSPLKIQLMTTGENTTTWGNVTNVNLGTAIEEMVTGSSDVTFASTTVTLTLTDTNASQTARNMRLNLTGTSGGAQNLIVPAVEKVYLVNNGCADAITVKNTTGTGIAVPAGKTMWVYNDGTNVTNAITHLTSLTLAAALPVTSGGTGVTTSTGSGNVVLSTSPTLTTPLLGTPTSGNLANCTGVSLTAGVSGTLPVANGGTGVATSTGSGNVVLSTSPTLVTPILGTPTSGNLSNCTGVSLTAGVSGTLPVANGGTGVATSTGSGNVVLSTSPTLVTPILGTPTSGNLSNCTGVSLTAGVSGTLPVANGGTGLTATPSNGQIDIGNGTGFTRAAITAGSGVSVTNGAGTITIAATGSGGTVTSVNASGGTTGLSFSGGPITGSGTLTLAGTLAVANGGTGGTSQATAQSALGVPSTTGSGASGTWGISISGNAATATSATTATTASTANALNSGNSYTAVDFTATSDMRLKDVSGPITDALDRVDALNGFYYRNNDKARWLGQVGKNQQVGLSAQDLQEVLPEAVSQWSIDPEYLVVAYDRVIPLLVEAIKELRAEVKALKG